MNTMKLAIIRSSSISICEDSYNIQEVGLATSLLRFKVSTDIYMVNPNNCISVSTVKSCSGASVRIINLPYIGLPGKQSLMKYLIRMLFKEKYDIIQVHEDSKITSVIVSIYAKIFKIPIVLCQGMYKNYTKKFQLYIQNIYDFTLLRLLRNNITCCIAKTLYAKNYLINKNFKKISVCHIGLDESKFSENEFVDWREKYNIPKDKKILLYVGAIEARRRVPFIIKIFDKIIKNGHDVYLMVAGVGPEMNKCEKLVCKCSLTSRVKFIGKVNQLQLPSLYSISYLFLLPSEYEIYGMVILESMYHGLPVISSSTAGSREIIRHNVDGFILNSFSINSWQGVIEFFLSDESARNKLSASALNSILESFTWNSTSVKFYNIYVDAVSLYKERFLK